MILSDSQKASLRAINRGWSNAAVIRHRNFDGQIASMRKSGTHWLKYMLGLLISRLYDVPPPVHIQDNSVVGHPKHPPIHAGIPRIVTCHSEPHYLMRSAAIMNTLHFPKYLILVRNPVESLVSDYEKHREDYQVTFSEYLRAGPRSKRHANNIWTQISFMNSWGEIIRKFPDMTTVVYYEDMMADMPSVLARVCDYFSIEGYTDDMLREVCAMASKTNMAQRSDPAIDRPAVRFSSSPAIEWYSDADKAYLTETFGHNLRHDFGYVLDRPEALGQPPTRRSFAA